MIRLIGILLVLSSSVLLGRVYTAESERRVLELSALIDFLRYAKDRVNCYLEPLAAIAEGYTDTVLERSGFLGELREGRVLSVAFGSASDKLSLPEDTKGVVLSALSSLDGSYKDGLVSGLDLLISSLNGIYATLERETRGRARVVRITAISAGLGLSIMLL
ncbi:MAG: hypothetical protein IJW48_05830 [Clostridia bacterium]|nr:hypothetical protein [Clostridia bacterium]MBQ7363947.1 hypothetical protein [Clostridia bacterium]